jgi:hypothetical protein
MFDTFYVLKENLMIYNLDEKVNVTKENNQTRKEPVTIGHKKYQNFHSPNLTLKVITLTAKLKRTPKYKFHLWKTLNQSVAT